ncbi:arylamine N-acetyltransferase [Weeksellaceae bacterium TAE3-ERU29]|nr:arylamine N-acetyltransferase [Weeksellaceae bacterium TAE3-ERU29]
MNIKEYLNRIKYKERLSLNFETLQRLQKQHLLCVPFENLDIHYSVPIYLDMDRIYHKIIKNKRGGFCYELNGLFCMLLQEIGFDAKMISVRVYNEKTGDFGEEFDHMAIIVTLEETEYLVDVGFGKFSISPLTLELEVMQSDNCNNYIIEKYDNQYFLVSEIIKNEKEYKYLFSEIERELLEFTEMCKYHQTDSESHFTQNKLSTKLTTHGRITITDTTLKVTQGKDIIVEKIFESQHFEKYVKEWFNVIFSISN